MILSGHIHRPAVLALATGGWAVQAGTAASRRMRLDAGNSVNLIRITASAAERATVERWDHDPSPGVLVQASVVSLQRPLGAADRAAG